MPKLDNAAVQKDFDEVLQFLAACRVISDAPSQQTRTLAKKVHGCTYSLIFWKFRLGELPAHSKPFIEEIASDALQILPQFLLGYGKTTKILARGILENTLRFIYFSDHPVEFAIMNRDEKWYMGTDKLIEYAKSHPDYVATEKRFDAINRVSSLYSELSAGIHGRRVSDLEMRSSLEKIHLDHSAAQKDAEVVRRCTEAANFLLAIYTRDALGKMTSEDRRIILRTFPKAARDLWAGLA